MRKLDIEIAEIEDFIDNLRFSSIMGSTDQHRRQFKLAYKQFHALLVWGIVMDTLVDDSSGSSTYFRETLSDMSHSFLLTLMHVYKPARMSLRSGIENFVRSLLLIRGVDPTQISSVFELFAEAKLQYKDEDVVLSNVNELHRNYVELCKTVHSTKIDYMSLSVPFEHICVFQNGRYTATVRCICSVSSAANQAMFFLWHSHLGRIGHRNEDLVRDAIPRALKRVVGERC